jgi:small subunit ribosomal protein S17
MTEQNIPGRTIIGKVVSDKMDKTLVIQIERKVKHPLYGKYLTRTSKIYAHDDQNTGKVGDLVLVANSRPISKTKNWTLVKVLEQAEREQTV